MADATRSNASSHAPSVPGRIQRRLALALVLVIGAPLFTLGTAGCGHQGQSTAGEAQASRAAGTISTTQISAPSGSTLGTTRISWTMREGEDGEVFVSMDGAPEQLFARGPKGTEDATWIQRTAVYEFRLYPVGNHTAPIATATVRAGVEAGRK